MQACGLWDAISCSLERTWDGITWEAWMDWGWSWGFSGEDYRGSVRPRSFYKSTGWPRWRPLFCLSKAVETSKCTFQMHTRGLYGLGLCQLRFRETILGFLNASLFTKMSKLSLKKLGNSLTKDCLCMSFYLAGDETKKQAKKVWLFAKTDQRSFSWDLRHLLWLSCFSVYQYLLFCSCRSSTYL